MKKELIVFAIIVILMSLFVRGEKAAVIKEIVNPSSMKVDDTRLYIVERTSIFIFSLKDYRFIKKFGKEGQGPGEFAFHHNVKLSIDVSTDDIFIRSLAKVSFFSKDGHFKREAKTKGLGWGGVPLKGRYVGYSQTRETDNLYNTINFFDADFNKGQEIARVQYADKSKNIEHYKSAFMCCGHENKVFVASSGGFVIDVIDHTGKKLYSITREYKRVKFDPAVEKIIHDIWKKTNPGGYEFFKKRLKFPAYFPAIRFFAVDDNKIYVLTWKKENKKTEFFILNLKGKLLKQGYMTVAFREGETIRYPMDIDNGKLYQLVENEEENWELHVSKF